MASPLGYVYSRADALKRQLYDMITNPRDYASMLGGRIVEGGQEREALMNQAFADPTNPLKITNEKALAALTDKIMQGEMGFAQAGVTSPAGVQSSTKKFLEMAEKGRLRMAKDRSAELRDLKEGKSNFAELSLNWDDPKTYDLVDEYAKEGFKTKVIDRGGRNVTYLYKNEKDIEGVLSATTPADYGRAYGYSDEDIARFYLERGLGPKDFFEDMGFKGSLLD